MRVLILSIERSGADEFALFLGKRLGTIVLPNAQSMKYSHFECDADMIVCQNIFGSEYVDCVRDFNPDTTILYARDPRDLWSILQKSGSPSLGGSYKDKFLQFERLLESGRCLIVSHEDFQKNCEEVVDFLASVLPKPSDKTSPILKTQEDVIAYNGVYGFIFGDDYLLPDKKNSNHESCITDVINDWIRTNCPVWMEGYMGNEYNVFVGDPTKKTFTFHHLGMTHIPPLEEYSSCAYTQKIRKLTKMLLDKGHKVFLYGTECTDLKHPNLKFIQCATLEEVREQWGDKGNNEGLGYNWKQEQFRHDLWGEMSPLGEKWSERAIEALRENMQDDHFLLCTQGSYHRKISDAVGLFLTVEPGVGYLGVGHKTAAFESNFMRGYIAGVMREKSGESDGDFYQRVIPNYFDTNEYPFVEKPSGDYFVFMGRVIERKGWDIARHVSHALGIKLKVVGQFKKDIPEDVKNDDWVEYIPSISGEEKAKILGNALVVFAPTKYYEPFGGVTIEAMLCGTPVVTTDFGVFPETIIEGLNGYRANTFEDFIDATLKAMKLNRRAIREYAESKYSMGVVNELFEKWWHDLYRKYCYTKIGKDAWWVLGKHTCWRISQVRSQSVSPYKREHLRLIGVAEDYNFDLNGRSVLDVGGGNDSLLLECKNYQGGVVDPLLLEGSYADKPIQKIIQRCEDANTDNWDEVWLCDVLRYVEDVDAFVSKVKNFGRSIRVLEPLYTDKNFGRLHSFTALDMRLLFGVDGKIVVCPSGEMAWTCKIVQEV